MKKVTAGDINQEMYDLYDDYVHSKIDRKRFLEKLSVYAVGGLTLLFMKTVDLILTLRMLVEGCFLRNSTC